MKTAKYIVIDIETLGRRNDAAITQVGTVIADENFDVLDSYLIQVTPDAWNTCERTFTGETLLWWMEQKNTPISKKPTHIVHSYKYLVDKLSQIFDRYNTEDTTIWTKGSMDLFCIKDLCEYVNMETPWKFWQPRDIRTTKEFVKDWKVCENNNAHNALGDALTELEELKLNLILKWIMKKELNIAEILKDKPKGTKLYSLACGKCELKEADDKSFKISFYSSKSGFMNGGEGTFDKNGNLYDDGECIVFPSKEMRDWSKFAWKKGDVLEATLPLGEKHMCIFDHWSNDDYSSFIARYDCQAGKTEINDIWRTDKYCLTKDYSLVIDTLQMTGKHKVETFIDNLEWKFKGKLNLNTLELIKHPILENGNILILHTINRFTYVFISNGIAPNSSCHAYLSLDNPRLVGYNTTIKEEAQIDYVTYATEEEKQRLFDALTKEGKRWNAEKKIIEDIKKEHQFKPFEKVLARDSKDSLWHIDLYEGMLGDDNEYNYSCMAADWVYCIPYEGNEQLLGTTKDVEENYEGNQ